MFDLNAFLERAFLELPDATASGLPAGQSTLATQQFATLGYPVNLRTIAQGPFIGNIPPYVQAPFRQNDWPNPLGPLYPNSLRTHTNSLNTTTLAPVSANPFNPVDTTARPIAQNRVETPQQNFTAIIPASTFNPFKPVDLFIKINAATKADQNPLNLLLSTLAVIAANPFIPTDTSARSIKLNRVDSPQQNFTSVIPASTFNPFIPKTTDAAARPQNRVETPTQNLLQTTLGFVQPPFNPNQWAVAARPTNVTVTGQSINNLATGLLNVPFKPVDLQAPLKFTKAPQQLQTNTTALFASAFPITPQIMDVPRSTARFVDTSTWAPNLSISTLQALPFAYSQWDITPRASIFAQGQTTGLNLPLFVATSALPIDGHDGKKHEDDGETHQERYRKDKAELKRIVEARLRGENPFPPVPIIADAPSLQITPNVVTWHHTLQKALDQKQNDELAIIMLMGF